MIKILSFLMMFCHFVQNSVLRPCIPKQRFGFKRLLLCALFLPLVVSACVRPGDVSTSVSEYDGTISKHMTLVPITLELGGLMGLYYEQGSDDIYIVLSESGIISLRSIGINIDGEFYDFPADGVTDFETNYGDSPLGSVLMGTYNVHAHDVASNNAFKVNVDFLRKMDLGKKVIIRVRTSEGYEDYNFSKPCKSDEFKIITFYACHGVNNFIKEHLI